MNATNPKLSHYYFLFLFLWLPLFSHAQKSNADELIKLAIEQNNKGNPDLAIDNCNKALTYYPGSAWAYLVRGLAYKQKRNYDQAIADYTKAIELNPKYTVAYNNRGVVYDAKGNHDQAIIDYTKAIELDPKYAIAYNNRGLAYKDKGNQDQAIIDYNKAIELDPKYAGAYTNRGLTYKQKGNQDQAILDYTKAIELDPKYASAYTNRGLVYDNKGSYDLAIIDYNKAIELNPKYTDAYLNRGRAYKDKGNYDQAISDYTKAIELNPKYTVAYNNRGVAYYNKGDYDSAIINYTAALQIDPLYKYSLLNIAPPLIRLNRFEEAAGYYQKYKTNNLTGFIETAGWEYYKFYLNAATVYLKGANYTQALIELKSGESAYDVHTLNKDVNTDAKTRYSDLLALKGYILLKLNKPQEALATYNQALVIKANQPEVKEAISNLTSRQTATVEKPAEKKITQDISDLPMLENSATPPKYYAILIAEQNYADKSINTLNQPIADALKLKQVLQGNYLFSPANIDTLFNRTKEDILSVISNRCNTLKETDNLLVFYSGHGTAEKDRFNKNIGYLIPTSAQKGNHFTYISNSDLTLALGMGDVKHILFIVDACFSGALFRDLSDDAPGDIKTTYNSTSRHIMSSGNLEPVPDNSVFISYVIKRLQENKEKYLTGNDLFQSFKKAVANNSDNLPQYNVIKNSGDEGGDFVFIKKK